MSCLYDMENKILLILSLALLLAGCSDSDETYDLDHRDRTLLRMGMIYYGEDPQERAFDDLYCAFAATDDELAALSATSLADFKTSVKNMPKVDRNYLEIVFNDIADLAVLANYSYKDEPVVLPEGWVDMSLQDPKIEEIINRPSDSGILPVGLKCSLISKGDRKVLVFAGTDFPFTWRDYDQVMHFLADVYEDIYGALNKDAAQVVLAREIVDELLQVGYVTKENLEFAGHSLGGRLASEMSVRYGCPAVIFNAAGVSPEVYQDYEKSKEEAGKDWRGYIINVVSVNDPLTCIQRYMSGSSEPISTKLARLMSQEKSSVDELVSIGLDLIGAVVDNVNGTKQEYGDNVNQFYGRDYRAIGAVMPIRENVAGHGINELVSSLRARAEICKFY